MSIVFKNRADAASRLAVALGHYRDMNALVLAIPRGAVPMGRLIADHLAGEADVVLVHALCSPNSREFAVGAIDESGWTYEAPHAPLAGATAGYLAHEQKAQLTALKRSRELYTPHRKPIDPAGRVVIVVDEGLATGSTMNMALHAIRAHAPARLVCAVPVVSMDGLNLIRHFADEVIYLEMQEESRHSAAGFYESLPPVTDYDVTMALRAGAAPGRT